MSNIFGYSREAVRVKVKKIEGSQTPEFRKFSVDPQITSFEVLQSILAKAFDLKGDFAICYRVHDISGHETYMPLLSDWDLDAAFLKAYNTAMANSSEPCLCLRVDLKPFEECADDWELKQNLPLITQIRTAACQEAMTRPSPRLHGIFNQMGKTLNMFQRALNFGDDGNVASLQPPRPPLSDSEFRAFLDPVGQIIYTKELRSVIYFGGIDPSLRKVVWKHLLNVYPDGMTGRERMDYIKKKAAEYVGLKEAWKAAVAQGPVAGELAYTTGMVRKDVLRTDRHHPFYAGSDDNQNIASLFNILTTYALNHPKVSYCQGMSDLASPLLVTMNDEAHAYICFCALMQRLCTNFMIDGIAMTQKFTHLAEGLMYYDPEFYNYLKIHQADDLLFCYRWLLLEMKREFAFDDSLRMLEVLWSSLPADPPTTELKLYDVQFHHQPVVTSSATATPPPVSPLLKTPRESAYTKVCALRRQSSSMSLSSFATANKKAETVKRQNHSLDETISKCKNNILLDGTKTKHQSLDDAVLTSQNRSSKSTDTSPRTADLSPRSPKNELRCRSVSPLEAVSDSVLLNNNNINNINTHKILNKSKSASLSSSMTNLIKSSKKSGHFKDLKAKIAAAKLFSSLDRLDATHSSSIKEEDDRPQGKMIKNLNEFLNFAAVNKNKISDTCMKVGGVTSCGTDTTATDKPKILLTKSSFDDSESSSLNRPRNYCSSTSNSCGDDTFDEYSPDDSQEYFPLTTSVTRELRLELENLDRTVFGDKFIDRLSESPSTDYSNAEMKTEKVEDVEEEVEDNHNQNSAVATDGANINHQLRPINIRTKSKSGDDIFVWENPLHQTTSPQVVVKVGRNAGAHTPDEQADIEEEYENELPTLVNEVSATKTVTPIKIINCTNKSKRESRCDVDTIIDKTDEDQQQEPPPTVAVVTAATTTTTRTVINCVPVPLAPPPMTNSCEEVTEAIVNSNSKTSSTTVPNNNSTVLLLPPPNEFGGGNPFLMFLCITVLLQHRDHIMNCGMDYNEMAMHFDKMVRKHNVIRVLNQARQMYARYLGQHTALLMAQQQQQQQQSQDDGDSVSRATTRQDCC